MCYHRLYIYAYCGHSTWAATPLVECEKVSIPPHCTFSTKCELTAHPYQSWKLESLCPKCYQTRSDMLEKLEQNKVVYEDWRWKVSYGMPEHGKDFWGRKAEERERLERETGKRTKRNRLKPHYTSSAQHNNYQLAHPGHISTMPTPKSEAFKAVEPKVPATFDGVDYDDNKALKAAQDAIIREQWVQSMMARLIREELGKCYHREGVNHLQNCQQLRDRYLEQLKHAKVKGYLFQQQNYFENREG